MKVTYTGLFAVISKHWKRLQKFFLITQPTIILTLTTQSIVSSLKAFFCILVWLCFYHVTYAFSVSESTLCECVNVFKNSMLFWFCLCFLSLVLLFLLLFLVSKSFLMVKGHLEAKGKVLSNLQAEWNCLENFLVYFDLMDGDKRVYHDFGNSVLK